ncbi:hypothetical protein OG937_05480 [Streptomyces sp. NBC_00510]|nr:hypothetical protein [Streptomyces sp. PA03-6a]
MDLKIRRLVFGAGMLGVVLGTVVGVFSTGTVYSVVVGALLCATAGVVAVLYWGEHGGARRRRARWAQRPEQIPHPRRFGRLDGPDAFRY